MSYTGSHLNNFIPSFTPAPSSSATMSTDPYDRREVRPLESSSNNAASTSTRTIAAPAPPPTAAPHTQPSNTANLEAQVRVLEQEVQLLRTGLVQNERLRYASAPAQQPKRVHFGPSSVIPIPGAAQNAAMRASGAAPLRTPRKGSKSPSRQPPRRPSPSTLAADLREVRPRLAFGQRVDPTQSRSTPSSHTASATSPTTSTGPQLIPSPTRSHNTTETSHSDAQGTSLATTSTTYVQLSPAPASLRGSNIAGIPLQGAATGATVVSALDGSSVSAPPAATVWASADPALLWKRAAAAVANSSDPRGSAGVQAGLLAGYPFRNASQPTVKATTTTPAAASASSPILVTMSSDGWSSSAPAQTGSESAPPHAASPATTSASVSVAPVAASAEHSQASPDVAQAALLASASAAPQTATEPSTDALQRQVEELRSTLEQREALLHRVLVELHGRASSSVEKEEQSRQTLRLLTQELLAAQSQLSHAKVSYNLLHEELQRRSEQQQQQQQQEPNTAQVEPVAAPNSVPVPPPVAAAETPCTAELQTQLDTALRKVKAWEDWYASTASAEADHGEPKADTAAAAAASPSRPEEKAVDKKKVKKSHDTDNEEPNKSHKYARGCGGSCRCCTCPNGGALLHNTDVKRRFTSSYAAPASTAHRDGAVPVSSPAIPQLSPARPPVSLYATNDALYNQLASNRYASAPQYVSSSSTARTGAAAATPPQEVANASKRAFASTSLPTAPTSSWRSREDGGGHHPQRTNANGDMGSGGGDALATEPSTSYYCDDLAHAKLQAYYSQQFVTQMAREAAVRELAEAERQVAEERLAAHRRQELLCTPPCAPPSSSTPKKESTKRQGTGETVDDK